MTEYSIIFDLFAVLVLIVWIWIVYKPIRKMKKLVKNTSEITVEEFLSKKYLYKEFPGIYILRNTKNNKHYVGQSCHVLIRLTQHFSGKGNKYVYKDYQKNHKFTIKMIPLHNSGFKTLNSLERYGIKVCKGYKKGYNKTRGNRG